MSHGPALAGLFCGIKPKRYAEKKRTVCFMDSYIFAPLFTPTLLILLHIKPRYNGIRFNQANCCGLY